jgi:hypothetical protein
MSSHRHLAWFTKEPGRPANPTGWYGSLSTTTPTVVRLPPDLGGEVSRVVGTDRCTCPDCGCEHDRWHLEAKVEGGHVAVVECPVFGKYLWVRIRDEVSP